MLMASLTLAEASLLLNVLVQFSLQEKVLESFGRHGNLEDDDYYA